MLKLLVIKAFKSPFALAAVCFVLYLAAHSFLVGVFVAFSAFVWTNKSIQAKLKSESAASEMKGVNPTVVTVPSKASGEPQIPVPTSIRRQYAKSAVVIPIKTGTDN